MRAHPCPSNPGPIPPGGRSLPTTDLPPLAGSSAELVRQRKRLMVMARCLVRDEATAEDIVHETLLRYFAGRLHPDGALDAYLSGVLRRVAAQRFRDAARRRKREARHAEGANLSRESHTGSAAFEQEEGLRHMLRRLDATARETVWLRYVQGLSVANIAALNSETESQVKCRLQRSAQRIKADEKFVGLARRMKAQLPGQGEAGDIHRLRTGNPRIEP